MAWQLVISLAGDKVPRNLQHSRTQRRQALEGGITEIQVIGVAAGTGIRHLDLDRLARIIDLNALVAAGGHVGWVDGHNHAIRGDKSAAARIALPFGIIGRSSLLATRARGRGS